MDNEKINIEINKGNFDEIFRQYYDSLSVYARRFVLDMQEAENIVSELFLKIYENMHNINVSISLKSYLYSAVHNRCLNYLKAQKHSLDIDDPFLQVVDVEPNYHDVLIAEELEEIINKFIDSLPNRQKQIFAMSRNENKTNKEIAKELDIEEITVRSSLRIVLDKLKNNFDKFLFFLIFFCTICTFFCHSIVKL